MKQILLAALLIFITCSTTHSFEQLTAKEHKAQVMAASTPKGLYATQENWPKDYFLIPHNLPFLVGLSLYKPGNELIGYNQEQRQAIHEIRHRTIPVVLAKASAIKTKELELVDKLVNQKIRPEKLHALVDEIAAMRAELTKLHLNCIREIQDIVTDEKQYKALLKHARDFTNK